MHEAWFIGRPDIALILTNPRLKLVRYLHERGKRTLRYAFLLGYWRLWFMLPHTVCAASYVTHAHHAHLASVWYDLASRLRTYESAERLASKDICGGRCLKRAVEDSLDFFRDLSLSFSHSVSFSLPPFLPQLCALFLLVFINIARSPIALSNPSRGFAQQRIRDLKLILFPVKKNAFLAGILRSRYHSSRYFNNRIRS